MLTQNQFTIMRYMVNNVSSTQRQIAENVNLSLGTVHSVMKQLREKGFLKNSALSIKGRSELDKYKVDNAIILAAGMATRFVPISYEFPKGLTVVKGEVLIERQIRQLHEAGVKNVIVVLGHMLEQFFYLKEKWGVEIVVNNDYKTRNTHASVYAAKEYLKNTYICCADNYYPENLFHEYEYHSMYCAQFLDGESRTERGLITNNEGLIIATEKPCKNVWTMQGHAFLSADFSRKFKDILEVYYNKPGSENLYWEGIYAENLDVLPMYMLKCGPKDILEFDSVNDLQKFDPDYINNNDLQLVKNICKVLGGKPADIKNIVPMNSGLTNTSFRFEFNGKKYVYRNPGLNTFGYINRAREKFALRCAKDLGIDNSYIFEDDVHGWKISHYIEETEKFDFNNPKHMEMLCDHLRSLHKACIKCGSAFDYFKETDKLIDRLKIIDVLTAEQIMPLRTEMEQIYKELISDHWPIQLSHNDIYEPNLIISGDDLYMIDWEYAGDTDIGYDISKLFAANDLPLEDIDTALSFYFKRKPALAEKKHILGCSVVHYYYWYVWALYQIRSGSDCCEWQLIWYNKMMKYKNEYMKLKESETVK